MIRRSTAIAAAAILVSLLVHFLGLVVTTREPSERSISDAATDVVALGNAFQDVAETTSAPVQAQPAQIPDPPAEEVPEPNLARTPTSQAQVASSNPQQIAAVDAESTEVAQPTRTTGSEPQEGIRSEPTTLNPPVVGETAKTVATPDAPQPAPDLSESPTPQQLAALPIEAPPVLPPTTDFDGSSVPVIPLVPPATNEALSDTTNERVSGAPETTEDNSSSDLAVIASLRPPPAIRRPPAPVQGGSDDGTEPVSSLLAPTQLVESPLTAYRRDGTDLIIQQNSSSRSDGLGFRASRGAGNAEATDYAGRVLVHLNRAQSIAVSGRGFARVFFQINPDGTLARVDVIDSSGVPGIDLAAKAQVRNASPFPLPPEGKSRSLVFVYRSGGS